MGRIVRITIGKGMGRILKRRGRGIKIGKSMKSRKRNNMKIRIKRKEKKERLT